MTLPSTPTYHPICLKTDFFPTVLDKVADGVSPLVICQEYGIRYSNLLEYVHNDPIRDKQFTAACKAAESWLMVRLTQEIQDIGLVDISQALNSDGTVKNMEDIPLVVRKTIASIEVAEIWESDGRGPKVQVGVLKKIKLNDKLKAIEMLGKKLRMFVDVVHHTGEVKVAHSVSDFDLEERILMVKNRKKILPPDQIKTVQDVVEDAEILEKPGVDI